MHEETKTSYLAIAVASKFSKLYHNRGRYLVNKNTTLPYILLDATQQYPVPLKQIILYSHYESTKNLKNYIRTGTRTEFRDLIEALVGSDKTLDDDGSGPKPKSDLNALRLEAQIIQNSKLNLDNANARLRTQKRKIEEHVLDYAVLKKRRSESGKPLHIYTSRPSYKEMESSGVSSGFTDLSVKQPLYNIRMSYSTSPYWIKDEKEEGINTTVCRSWDDQFNCIHCSPKHSIFSNDAFGLIIGDQHFPSRSP